MHSNIKKIKKDVQNFLFILGAHYHKTIEKNQTTRDFTPTFFLSDSNQQKQEYIVVNILNYSEFCDFNGNFIKAKLLETIKKNYKNKNDFIIFFSSKVDPVYIYVAKQKK